MDQIIEKIKKPIGKKVKFRYPEGEKSGILKDRAVIASNPHFTGVPYWDVVDLIEFHDDQEPLWIRIGYYRKPKDRLVFAGQTTITEPISVWKKILVEGAKEKSWFKELLEEIMDELKI